MPAGSWHLGRLRRKVDYVGLRELGTVIIRDDNPFSDDYFNIVEFPTVFTAGKNLFKIKANANTLVRDSKVHIEILDFNGDAIYYEVVQYAEVDGTRVIAIWIYPDTPPGAARVFVGGRARLNPVTGETYSFSYDVNAPDYYNLPNVLWSRAISVAPSQLNNTEIIYRDGYFPRIQLKERNIPYLQPVNLENTIKTISASAGETIRIVPFSENLTGLPSSIMDALMNSNDSYGQFQAINYLQSLTNTDWYQTNEEVSANDFVDSTIPNEIVGFSRAVIGPDGGASIAFTSNMVGGQITIKDPIILASALSFANSNRNCYPYSQHNPQFNDTYNQANPIAFEDQQFTFKVDGGLNNDGSTVSADDILVDPAGVAIAAALPQPGNMTDINEVPNASLSPPIHGPNTGASNVQGGLQGIDPRGGFTGDTNSNGYTKFFSPSSLVGYGPHYHYNSVEGFGLIQSPPIGNLAVQNSFDNNIPFNSSFARLSGSYQFGILNILNSTEALVYMIGGPVNQEDITGGAFEVDIAQYSQGDGGSVPNIFNMTNDSVTGWRRDTTYPSGNITMSFLSPYDLQLTPITQSFADIIFTDIDPDTGDVYKIKTEYKPGGQFGDWIDAGDSILEQYEILVDSGSFDSEIDADTQEALGLSPVFKRIGFFQNQDDVDFIAITDPQIGALAATNENTPTITFDAGMIINAARVQSAATFGEFTQRFGYFAPKFTFARHSLWVTENTSYIMKADMSATDDIQSTDPNVPLPRFEFWIYHSTQTPMQTSAFNFDNGMEFPTRTPVEIDYRNTAYQLSGESLSPASDLPADIATAFGTKIGTIEAEPSMSIRNVNLIFTAPADGFIWPTFVIRRGTWHIGQISIKSLAETGFTPNYFRTFKHIFPTPQPGTPYSFRFRFFDFQGTEAALRAYVYPVFFTGENMVIGGNFNLLTGSLYISNEVGKGIQASGEGSGFIRSVGYQGFTKAASGSNRAGGTKSGFMMYSGSVLSSETSDYQTGGVGFELVHDSASFFTFATTGSRAGIHLKTPKFFLGREETAFVSGSEDGKLEISSSAFHLTRDGKVIIPSLSTRATPSSPAGNFVVDGNISASGNIVANEYHVRTVSSSVLFSDGNTQFGDDPNDVHSFSGSITAVTMSGGRIEGGIVYGGEF